MKTIWRRGNQGLLIPAQPVIHGGGSVQPVLLDYFTGTGQINAHTPDIYPESAAWYIASGTWPDLASGLLPCPTAGSHAHCVIDTGLSNCVVRWRVRNVNAVTSNSSAGMAFRSTSNGGDYYRAGSAKNTTTNKTSVGWNLPSSIKIHAGQANNQYNDLAVLYDDLSYHTWEIWLSDDFARMVDENGTILLASGGALKTGQNYVGPYTFIQNTNIKWDWLRVLPFTKNLTIYCAIGDSITSGADSYAASLTAQYKSGYTKLINHGYSGYGILGGEMDTLINLAGAETTAQFFTILLGANDGTAEGVEAEYLENIQDLYANRGKPIYCMGRLTQAAGDNDELRLAINAAIEAAVTTAVAGGVNAEYWSTTGWLDPATDLSDGLHPTAAGQIKIMNEVLSRLP